MTPLYDVKSAATLLGVSPWTVRSYVRTGKLRPIRLGRLVRVEEQELQKFLADARGEFGTFASLEKSRER